MIPSLAMLVDVSVGLGAASAVAYLSMRLLSSAAALRYAYRHPETAATDAPRIDVLQPILSGDPDLRSALRDNVLRNAPSVFFLWLIDRDDSVALAIATELQQEFPERILLIETEPFDGVGNPKVAKLIVGAQRASAEWLAILDDDTRLGERQLAIGVAALRNGADLYTGLPSYDAALGLPSHALAQFVNASAIPTYLAPLVLLEPVTINGMFYLGRTTWFRESQAFDAIRNELCDDYALAKFVIRRGERIRQGIASQRIRTTVSGWKHYFALMHRWLLFAGVLLRDQPLGRRVLLSMVLGLPPLLLWGTLLSLTEPWYGIPIVAVTFFGRWGIAVGTRHRLGLAPVVFDPLTSFMVELLTPLHAVHAELVRTISWRSRRFKVGRDGSFKALPG